jgi:hypothetical protein
LGSDCGQDGEECSEAVGGQLGGEGNGSEIGYGVGLEMGWTPPQLALMGLGCVLGLNDSMTLTLTLRPRKKSAASGYYRNISVSQPPLRLHPGLVVEVSRDTSSPS